MLNKIRIFSITATRSCLPKHVHHISIAKFSRCGYLLFEQAFFAKAQQKVIHFFENQVSEYRLMRVETGYMGATCVDHLAKQIYCNEEVS